MVPPNHPKDVKGTNRSSRSSGRNCVFRKRGRLITRRFVKSPPAFFFTEVRNDPSMLFLLCWESGWSQPTKCRKRKRTAGCHSQIGCSRSEEHTSELQSRFDLVCR